MNQDCDPTPSNKEKFLQEEIFGRTIYTQFLKENTIKAWRDILTAVTNNFHVWNKRYKRLKYRISVDNIVNTLNKILKYFSEQYETILTIVLLQNYMVIFLKKQPKVTYFVVMWAFRGGIQHCPFTSLQFAR